MKTSAHTLENIPSCLMPQFPTSLIMLHIKMSDIFNQTHSLLFNIPWLILEKKKQTNKNENKKTTTLVCFSVVHMSSTGQRLQPALTSNLCAYEPVYMRACLHQSIPLMYTFTVAWTFLPPQRQIVGSMQECRKWHFGWNWVLYKYWKYIQKHTIQALHQVPTQTNDNFRAKIRCQKTRKNKGILSIKWLLLQNDQNALTTLLHWADEMKCRSWRIYNPGKNGWDTLSDLREKETPSPNAMLIHVILSETLPDPQHWFDDGGWEGLW